MKGWGRSIVVLLALVSSARADAARDPLESPDVDVVYAALDDVAARKDATAVPRLLDAALSTKYPHVAVLCGDVARGLGADALGDEALAAHVERTRKGNDLAMSQNLARFLAACRDPRFDGVLAFLVSAIREPAVQIEALEDAAGMGPTDPAKFPKLCAAVGAALSSPHEFVRAMACQAAGRMRLDACSDPVLRIACASRGMLDAAFAAVACRRLGVHGQGEAIERALATATHAQQFRPMLRTISLVLRREDVKSITTLLRSPKGEVREAAARAIALEWAHDPAAPPPAPPDATWAEAGKLLVELALGDESWSVRDAARAAAIRLGAPARDAMKTKVPAALDATDVEVACGAIEIVGELGMTEEQAHVARIAIASDDGRRRAFAARALARMQPANAVTAMVTAIHDARATAVVEARAAAALGYVPGREAVEALVKVLEQPKPSAELRAETERALEKATGRRLGTADRWRAWLATVTDPSAPRLAAFDRAALRREATTPIPPLAAVGGERALERALRWLEREQHDVGTWAGAEKGYGGVRDFEAVYTGLGALAYLGAGYRGTAGRYRETVRRATDWLAALQTYEGSFPVGTVPMPQAHSVVTSAAGAALVEAAVLGGDHDLDAAAQRAVDGLVRGQTLGASWPGIPRESDVDTWYAAWAMPFLVVARAGGFDVAPRTFDGVDAWLQGCSTDCTGLSEDPKFVGLPEDRDAGPASGPLAYGWTQKRPEKDLRDVGPRVDWSITEMVMSIRALEGWARTNPFLVGGARLLASHPPDWETGGIAENGERIYWRSQYWAFGGIAMNAMGGGRRRAWNERVARLLDANQRDKPEELVGSWDPDIRGSPGEGRIESTTVNALALEAPYRFPALKR